MNTDRDKFSPHTLGLGSVQTHMS
uniref:Uncharacterized protein n=1 Tax=Anguilla anguilla TaxID=7936 RepID=A0A0E9V4X2_ANGAN